jgi:hypothetical protein
MLDERKEPMTPTDREFADRQSAWMEAAKRKDLDALEHILAPEFAYTSTGQGRTTRQEWLDTIAIYDLQTFEIVELESRLYGDDVAVVLSRYRQTATLDGVARSGEFLITDVWVKRGDSWQVAARSSIKMSS